MNNYRKRESDRYLIFIKEDIYIIIDKETKSITKKNSDGSYVPFEWLEYEELYYIVKGMK